MKSVFIIVLAFLLLSCAESSHFKRFDTSKPEIDLSKELMGDWEKVCFIGPYSNNESAVQTLGFEFDIEEFSGIAVDEGITLLVTVENSQVSDYYGVRRNNADFSKFSSKCFLQSDAKFKIKRGESGWPYVQRTKQGA